MCVEFLIFGSAFLFFHSCHAIGRRITKIVINKNKRQRFNTLNSNRLYALFAFNPLWRTQQSWTKLNNSQGAHQTCCVMSKFDVVFCILFFFYSRMKSIMIWELKKKSNNNGNLPKCQKTLILDRDATRTHTSRAQKRWHVENFMWHDLATVKMKCFDNYRRWRLSQIFRQMNEKIALSQIAFVRKT